MSSQSWMKWMLLVLVGVGLMVSAQAAQETASGQVDVPRLLQEADAYRLPPSPVQVKVTVKLFKDGKLDKERPYTVLARPDLRSLVLFDHPSEKNQKVLMVDDDFWIILPNSRRPVRITPMQKLLGEASTGDIARMTWSGDYHGKVAGETTVDGAPCLILDLEASRSGVSYQRIKLYIERDKHYPIKGELYVASGKLAKVADYQMGEMEGVPIVTTMVLTDRINTNMRTEVRYREIKERDIPDRYFNAAYLVRNVEIE